ncbi:hypothetical protein CQA66_07685 [Helicobacter aurati]|uniref:SAM-dependent methyltransferase n=1 Tax=Helicobacter aurati TaxID=137778 RepID=A0A3D8J1R8_9HELI|nr:SAM-dependent methyltransferase [Helicobacter aurati]RDU70711.1 hypothetical protein CQA66_07685 [Helicobacter aurati]
MANANKNLMPFREYMRLWLYQQNDSRGYYANNNHQRIGKKGDFYTSVSVSKFFGGAIAHYIIMLLEKEILKLPLCIVEIGSNNADLISDIAEFLTAFNKEVFQQCAFYTLEPLQSLQYLQQQTFTTRITSRFHKQLHTFTTLENIQSFIQSQYPCNQSSTNARLTDTFFISNELLDSMPCDVVLHNQMLFVDSQNQSLQNPSFVWKDIAPEVREFCDMYQIRDVEVSLALKDFVQTLTQFQARKWIFLTFDYGEFISRDMNLRLYHEHNVYNFYEELQQENIPSFYQKSDITYDVNFGLLQQLFAHYHAECLFCATQANVLIQECKILEIFELFAQQFNAQTKLKQQVKLRGLIAPNAMGERFKSACFIGGIN